MDRPLLSITPASSTPAPAPPLRDQDRAEALQRQARRETLTRRVRFLVAVTITYNVLEAVVALAAGHRADSTALIGFGLDSVIEVSSPVASRLASRCFTVVGGGCRAGTA